MKFQNPNNKLEIIHSNLKEDEPDKSEERRRKSLHPISQTISDDKASRNPLHKKESGNLDQYVP